MDNFDEEQPYIILQFPHDYGYDTFPLLPEDAKKIAMMKPNVYNSDEKSKNPHRLQISNNHFTAVRDMNTFQYSYKTSEGAAGYKTSCSLFDFPKLAKMIFSALNELKMIDPYAEDNTITVTLSNDDISII